MADIEGGVVWAAVFAVITALCLIDSALLTITGIIRWTLIGLWNLLSGIFVFFNFHYAANFVLSPIYFVVDCVTSLVLIPVNVVVFLLECVLWLISTILYAPVYILTLFYYIVYYIIWFIAYIIGTVISLGFLVVDVFVYILECIVVCLLLMVVGKKVRAFVSGRRLTWKLATTEVATSIRVFLRTIGQEGLISFTQKQGLSLRRFIQQIISNWDRVDKRRESDFDVGGVDDVIEDGATPSTSFDDEARTCIVCFDGPRDSVIFPCGHAQFCSNCVQIIYFQTRKCPVCNGHMDEFRRIFV